MRERYLKDLKLEDGVERKETFSELTVRLRSAPGEVWLSTEYVGAYRDTLAEPVPDWTRYVGKDLNSDLRFIPRLPNRPVLLEPIQQCKVLPGSRVNLYAFIPLFIAVEGSSKSLGEFPTKLLSDTWFGELRSGELCYTVATQLEQELEAALPLPSYIAACPIRIRNKSSAELIIRTLCIRVQWLSLYRGASGFVTNETLISYKGEDQPSEIHVASSAPGNVSLVSSPRDTPPRSLSIRSFVSLLGL